MNDTGQTVASPVAKVATAIGSAGGVSLIDRASSFSINGWADVAAMAAAFYSMLLITEWFWRKFWRPMLERRGILKPKPRRLVQRLETEPADL